VSRFAPHLPGNYWFFLAGALIDGALGGKRRSTIIIAWIDIASW
jgi:hypothetical protein